MKNKMQTRAASVATVNEEARTAEFVISTEAVDSYGTVFRASGWDFTRYNENPVVTFQHDDHSSDPDMVIGTSEIRQEDGKTIATVTFEAAEDNPLAEKIFRKVKNGILRGASVYFHPHEAHMGNRDRGEDPDVLYFTRQELMAWSIVTIPSNPETLSRNIECVRNFRATITEVDAQVVKGDKEKNELDQFEARYMYNVNNSN